MFRSKKPSKSIEVTKLSSLIADNVEIVGDVVFSGGLRVDGRIEGNVINKDGAHGLLVLSDKGGISGRVKVYDAVVNGAISGDLEVEHFLELQAKARVSGNIRYRQLQMECGATIEGKLERSGEERARAEVDDAKVVELGATQQAAGSR
ncbi:polymer-forming cytoskeletal protein [Pseudothauera nasutitermitis]|uniref:Polymer-forming cytoskeletal protein n=1 Tax=Pseudothauera nasutitermitis TaxID=2565930 RepID=A0A4S4B377_9RHOO|nr:polymer-forming cytoskeletal protein [Pseudothauera nasutitermitis]THF67108.1 polymer-forming cytoskeletal protein [Pseudothauera nasutitermitis]